MLTKLTKDHKAKIEEQRKRYFDFATSTEPADRPRAESAIRALAEIGGVKINRVVWVASPEDGANALREAWNSLRASLNDSLRDSLNDSLRASLSASLRDSLRASLNDSLRASLGASLRASLSASLSTSLRNSLSASLSASLHDSLRSSLRNSLRASLIASLRNSLRDSLSDHYHETPWWAYYLGARDVLDVSYAQEDARRLALFADLIESCWAAWIAPGVAILCARPATVEIRDGNLIGITWRKE